jgi:lysophospholipase L1-like esterase
MKFILMPLGLLLLMVNVPLLGAEKVVVEKNMKLFLPARKIELTIEPLERFSVTDTIAKVPVATPTWDLAFQNKNARPAKFGCVYKSMVPGSMKIRLDGRAFVENQDYLVNYDWGVVGLTANTKIPADATLQVEYEYTGSRVDLVELSAEGKIILKKGVEDRLHPATPDADAGATPLFAVYLEPGTMELDENNLLMIDPAVSAATPVFGAEHLAKFKKLLRAGGPVKVVCIGDSITAGGGAGTSKYVDRLQRYLDEKYPGRATVINSGIGGDSSTGGLKRLQTAVLAYKPDLVIIMFGVNDENANKGKNAVPVPSYKSNLTAMVNSIRAAGGADIILMTTSWKNLGWEHTCGNLGEYAASVRELGQDMNLCVVDNFQAWANLKKRGIPYMSLLDSGINHPNGQAHEIFFNGIRSALE